MLLILAQAIENPIRFAGQYEDKETGWHYNWQRYYAPELGRYITHDPIGLAGGLNPYAYANGNPINYFDPTGEIIPLVVVWVVVEISLSIWDIYDTAMTLLDPCASNFEKWMSGGLFIAGVFLPGGGYSQVDNVGKKVGHEVVDRIDDVTLFAKKVENKIDDIPLLPGSGGGRNLPFNDADRLAEVNKTLDRIESAGPFPNKKDGTIFRNKEGKLPDGNYREYTVDTPGASNRGKRRVVQDVDSGRTYYTDDHYDNFIQIDPTKR